MPKMLKVTKPDKTVHVVDLGNKKFYQTMNNMINGPGEQWKLEEIEITEKELAEGKIPFIDETFVTAKEAQGKVASMEAEIDHLRRQLALKSEGGIGNNGALMDPASASRPFAAEAPITGAPASTDEFNLMLKEVAAKQSSTIDESSTVEEDHKTAVELIAEIKDAKTEQEIRSLVKNETRKTVLDAVTKRIEEIRESA